MIEIREARLGDSDELTALQAQCPQGSSFVVRIVNIPDFFSRSRIYENSRVYVACEGDRIVGSAACAVHDAVVDGRVFPIGYQFQAFVAPDRRRSGVAAMLTAQREEFFRQQGAVLAYTLIMEGNLPSIRYIEEQGFRRHRKLIIPGLHVFRETAVSPGDGIRPAAAGDLGAIATLLNRTWSAHALYEPVTAESLGAMVRRRPDFAYDNLIMLEEAGEIVACIGYWEWFRIMQITVLAVTAKRRLRSMLYDTARSFHPMPRSFEPGDSFRQLMLTPIGFREPALLRELIRYINNLSLRRGADVMYFVCEPGHPMLAGIEGIPRIDTNIHLYIKPFRNGIRLDAPIFVDGIDL